MELKFRPCRFCGNAINNTSKQYCSEECRKKRVKIQNRLWQNSRKLELVKMLGGCCFNCGYKKCLYALEFHHIDPKNKNFDIGGLNLQRYSMNKLKEEVKKTILLCSNCHRCLHYKGRKSNKKDKLLQMKGGCCSKCFYKECNGSLDFHHTDPSKKLFNISRAIVSSKHFSENLLLEELDKTIILCSNCHREEHFNTSGGNNIEDIERYKKSATSWGKITHYNHICKTCKKEFVNTVRSSKYCSKECFGASCVKEYDDRECLNCKKMYTINSLNTNSKFCSTRCGHDYNVIKIPKGVDFLSIVDDRNTMTLKELSKKYNLNHELLRRWLIAYKKDGTQPPSL